MSTALPKTGRGPGGSRKDRLRKSPGLHRRQQDVMQREREDLWLAVMSFRGQVSVLHGRMEVENIHCYLIL